mmetsp:Transcript_36228/g.59291  ORF Transcript_36228/g.59291 Transcript_36228/m.59291 type:complete len:316 (+) Transcript_36228:65-1012(+)
MTVTQKRGFVPSKRQKKAPGKDCSRGRKECGDTPAAGGTPKIKVEENHGNCGKDCCKPSSGGIGEALAPDFFKNIVKQEHGSECDQGCCVVEDDGGRDAAFTNANSRGEAGRNDLLTDDEHSETEEDMTDPHCGLDLWSAGDPYTNRGRSEEVWKVLLAYGFRREKDCPSPSVCFEKLVRKTCKRYPHDILENGQLAQYPIHSLAQHIRNDWHEKDEKDALDNLDDAEVVRQALSHEGLLSAYYYSFCHYDGLVQSNCTWHCRICGKCQDWREWHCKGCNKCQYGASIPCKKCSPTQYKKIMENDGWDGKGCYIM